MSQKGEEDLMISDCITVLCTFMCKDLIGGMER